MGLRAACRVLTRATVYALAAAQEDFKVQLAALEKGLLEALATSEGDILENTGLIEGLTRTKSKSAEIAAALQEVAAAPPPPSAAAGR